MENFGKAVGQCDDVYPRLSTAHSIVQGPFFEFIVDSDDMANTCVA